MSGNLDLFAPSPAAQPKPKAPALAPYEPTPPAPSVTMNAGQACARRATEGGHVCRVGGGDASFSDDDGKTWFCVDHRPAGFLPKDRVA
jgi:hypothetical protein